MDQLFSPRQVARALGVSESSMKRWCDGGMIETVRTVGGHRRLQLSSIIRFAREQDHAILFPELIGMQTRTDASDPHIDHHEKQLVNALILGQETLARQIVFDLYLGKHSISEICDGVISVAFREIGERWEYQAADVYQERRACEVIRRILFELHRVLPNPDSSWTACGGTLEGDPYTLPTTMVELVLRDVGLNAVSLGTSIPFASMARAITSMKPKIFWVCAAFIADEDQFVVDFQSLCDTAQAVGTVVVVGGRAFHEAIRLRLKYCCYCDTMQQLEQFARSARQLGTTALGTTALGTTALGTTALGTTASKSK